MSIMKVTVDTASKKGLQQIVKAKQLTREEIRKGWFAFGRDLKTEANREILHGKKSGLVYHIARKPGGKRRRHQSSKSPESHANLSGALRRSLSWKVQGHVGMEFGYGVSTTAKNAAPVYARAIEFGRPAGSANGRVYGKIKPRPSLKNAIRVTTGTNEIWFGKGIVRRFST